MQPLVKPKRVTENPTAEGDRGSRMAGPRIIVESVACCLLT